MNVKTFRKEFSGVKARMRRGSSLCPMALKASARQSCGLTYDAEGHYDAL